MKQVILHGHIFKNAGTTFDWSLARNFADKFLDHRQDLLMRQQGGAHLAEVLDAQPHLCALSSHNMPRDIVSSLDTSFTPIYLLRHPLLRVRSVYEFERKQQVDTPGANAARTKSYIEYIAWRMQPAVRPLICNYQALYLSGHHETVSEVDLRVRHAPRAMEVLDTHTLLGLVERYDESMVVFEDKLNTSFADIDLSYVAQNVSERAKLDGNIDLQLEGALTQMGSMAESLSEANEFDLLLYQAASEQLQQQISAVDSFDDKLAAFKQRCQSLRALPK